MRIITGSARGRPLVVPRGNLVRPTSDRVREAVFSALGPGRCADAHVLDLYAGSGALGLEAASRGAAATVLVERDRHALDAIAKNVERTRLDARVASQDVAAFLRAVPREAPFDLVFVDPPYADAPAVHLAALDALGAPGWCRDDVTVVLETPAGTVLPPSDSWRIAWERRFGGTLMTFVNKER